MKTVIRITAFLIAAVGFATDATAQRTAHTPPEARTEIAAVIDTAPGAAARSLDSRIEPGAFERLSAANRKRAEAVFNGQSVTALGSAPMNLDRIATLQRLGGWKLVFSRMKDEGLTKAKSVRQLLAGPRKQRGAQGAAKPRLTVVTNGAGHHIIVVRKPPAGSR